MPAVSAELNDFAPAQRDATTKPARTGWFKRFLAAVQESRLKQAEREVARFIEIRGGRITDTLEREIEHHFV